MKIVLINGQEDGARSINLNGWARALLSVVLLAVPVAAGTLMGVKLADGRWQFVVEQSAEEVQALRAEVASERQQLSHKLTSMRLKLAQMRARLVRLDAMGERLTVMAGLDDGEFDFSSSPGVGGPSVDVEELLPAPVEESELFAELEALKSRLDDRHSQLLVLQSMLADRQLQQQSRVTGRPITSGWMSSPYGTRTDPFDGDQRWHGGVDFAGVAGSDVVAVASGVVTWSADRYGYGQMVELDHGDGLVTRYAHNSENLVAVGDVVKKGQAVALMGSSGRSTGPHVHFEVYKNGRTVDPASYIRRTIR